MPQHSAPPKKASDSYRPLWDQSFKITTWPLPGELGPLQKLRPSQSQCHTCPPTASPCYFRAILLQRTFSQGPSQWSTQQDSLTLTLSRVQSLGYQFLPPQETQISLWELFHFLPWGFAFRFRLLPTFPRATTICGIWPNDRTLSEDTGSTLLWTGDRVY